MYSTKGNVGWYREKSKLCTRGNRILAVKAVQYWNTVDFYPARHDINKICVMLKNPEMRSINLKSAYNSTIPVEF